MLRTTQRLCAAVLATVLLGAAGCGSDEFANNTLDGTWIGSNDSWSNVTLVLHQNGNDVTGTASYTDLNTGHTGTDDPLTGTDFSGQINMIITPTDTAEKQILIGNVAQANDELRGTITSSVPAGTVSSAITLNRQ